MRDFFKLKMWVLTFGMMILAISFSVVLVYSEYIVKEFSIVTDENIPDNVEYAMAATTDNVSGWAWSENIGWISFNCANYDTCQGGTDDGLACTGSNCGDGACINTCDNFSDYGVNIDPSTGGFSGYAWSDNVGWIAFERAKVCNDDNSIFCQINQDCVDAGATGPCGTVDPDSLPDDYDFNVNCSNQADCDGAGDDCTACYNSTDNNIYGWAKILSLGDDGWIKLRDVSWADGVIGIPISGELSGWAWNGSGGPPAETGVGWISFNCDNYDSCDAASDNPGEICTVDSDCPSGACVDTCNISDYAVTSTGLDAPPTVVINSPADDPIFSDPCSGLLSVTLRWTFDDVIDGAGNQTAYWVQIKESADTWDNSINGPTLNQEVVSNAEQVLFSTGISYNKNYDWRVAVRDSIGLWSATSTPIAFNTIIHEYPNVDFNWFPNEPSAGEETLFTDASNIFTSPGVSELCDPYANNCSYQWSVDSGGTINGASTNATSSITFDKDDVNGNVTLKITDGDGFTCSLERTINPKQKLPSWTEF